MAKKKGFLKGLKKGALHKQLGIPEKKKIPVTTLEKLKNSKNPKTRKRANFALAARKWKNKIPRPR